MAEALIKGIVRDSGPGVRGKAGGIMVSEPDGKRREYLEQAYGVKTTALNREAASSCSIIILAVKPQNMAAVLDEIAEAVTDDKTVVSIAAGITLSYLRSRLKTGRLVRVMPNTPAIVRKGISAISPSECMDDRDMAAIREIFTSVGKVLTLPEKYMDTVTALSGSGPAFFAFFTEAMTDSGISMGLSRENASELAVQTIIGTAELLKTGMSPQKLREMVTSPGGTTAAGLNILEKKGLKKIVSETIEAARTRAEELGRKE